MKQAGLWMVDGGPLAKGQRHIYIYIYLYIIYLYIYYPYRATRNRKTAVNGVCSF